MEQVSAKHRKKITVRVSDDVQTTLDQAAELLGVTVSHFVVQAAYQEAQRILERESVIYITQKNARAILALIDSPPRTKKALKNAVKAYKGSVRALNKFTRQPPKPGRREGIPSPAPLPTGLRRNDCPSRTG